MTTEQFIHAIAMTESGDNINAHDGDNNRAFGRFQMHLDWMWWQASRHGTAPRLNETIDSFQTRLLVLFFNQLECNKLGPVERAMYFHIGHIVHANEADWDKGYEDRFVKFSGN